MNNISKLSKSTLKAKIRCAERTWSNLFASYNCLKSESRRAFTSSEIIARREMLRNLRSMMKMQSMKINLLNDEYATHVARAGVPT